MLEKKIYNFKSSCFREILKGDDITAIFILYSKNTEIKDIDTGLVLVTFNDYR